jgi:hypothetical protein
LFKLVLDLGGEVGAARDAGEVLADHDVEATVGSCGFVEEFLDTAIAWNRDVEQFVGATGTTASGVLTAGLDVVEVRANRRVLGQRLLTVPQLARQRQGRILQVVR